MFIEGIMHTRLTWPIFSVLVHSKTPDDLLFKACQLCSVGSGHPQFLNNDVLVAQALAREKTGGPAVTLTDTISPGAPIGASPPRGSVSGQDNCPGGRAAILGGACAVRTAAP